MSFSASNDRRKRLDAFLDGLLDHAERDVFERELTHDATLRAEIAVQHTIDAALRRVYAAPPLYPSPAGDNPRTSRPASIARGRFHAALPSRRFVVAAVVALGVLGSWRISMWLDARPGPDPYDRGPRLSLGEAYRREVASGFDPDWVCEDQQRAARLLKRRFGQGLVFEAAPGITALGWSYVNTITPSSVGLLVDVHGDKVMVFMDRLEADTSQSVGPDTGLHLHRRETGSLVLYEVSRLDTPVALDRFRAP